MRNLLGSENLDNPRNALMLAPVARNIFDGLDLWLAPFEVDWGSSLCTINLPNAWRKRLGIRNPSQL